MAALVVMATTLALAAVMALGVSAENADAATAVTKTFSNIAQIQLPSGTSLISEFIGVRGRFFSEDRSQDSV